MWCGGVGRVQKTREKYLKKRTTNEGGSGVGGRELNEGVGGGGRAQAGREGL